MAKAKPATGSAARWAKRVERLGRSGLSIRTFAAREGLKAGSLSFWKWKLAQRGQWNGRAQAEGMAPVQFVELTARPAAPARVGFEVVLSSGRMVRVASGFDAGELARLVGVLEEARS
ncbi:MAG TPA: hypothetical protein VMK12_22515 [Anaeromyxobacteraceae bacterium]|nr:hypothetical protein [Anaeromyxobacteraceae bacterium]